MRIKTYGCVDRCPISTRYIGISSIVFDQNSIKLSAFPRGKRGGMTDDVRVVSPNIIGEIASTNGLGVGNGNPSMSGALSMVYVDQRWAGFADAAGKYLRSISFDASGSSATYGSSYRHQAVTLPTSQ